MTGYVFPLPRMCMHMVCVCGGGWYPNGSVAGDREMVPRNKEEKIKIFFLKNQTLNKH